MNPSRDSKGKFVKGHPYGLRFGHGQKMFITPKGTHNSPKSEFKKGDTSSRKGIKKPGWTNKTSFEKGHTIRIGMKHNEATKKKISKALSGRKQSKELIEKRRQAIWGKERYEMQVKAILKGLMKRPTSLEKQMIDIIKRNNLPYKYTGDGSFLVGHKNPDFVNINGEKKLIEVANLQHHDKNYPKERSNYFKKWGWKSYIFHTKKLNEEIILKILKGEI